MQLIISVRLSSSPMKFCKHQATWLKRKYDKCDVACFILPVNKQTNNQTKTMARHFFQLMAVMCQETLQCIGVKAIKRKQPRSQKPGSASVLLSAFVKHQGHTHFHPKSMVCSVVITWPKSPYPTQHIKGNSPTQTNNRGGYRGSDRHSGPKGTK